MEQQKHTYLVAQKGKIIRDVVHGDIFIQDRFLTIIDTPEFQRLRRIKQLSVANMVFPSADHTRFSHSIGCFHVMSKIIEKFEKLFSDIQIEISQGEKDVALLAALLHDIGHGPFSHAFENIHPDKSRNVSHEEWTTRIIGNKAGAIFQNIAKHFGQDVPEQVISLIQKQRVVKKSSQYSMSEVNLFEVLSSLVSSQLDSDRLDYLVRDSFFTGVLFGKIDISRIITALSITVCKNKYYVCVPEKYLEDVEHYLLARLQMQKAVYYHKFKIEMEIVIKQIFKRALELRQAHKLPACSPYILKLFGNDAITVDDYLCLDDAVFLAAFNEWSRADDEILSSLCKTFLLRNKAKRVSVLNNSEQAFEKFKVDICKAFCNYGYDLTPKTIINESFWIESTPEFSAYKPSKENIWISKPNGTVVDISSVSDIIRPGEGADVVFLSSNRIIFINYGVLSRLNIEGIQDLITQIKLVSQNYNIRNEVEIEKKYHFDSPQTFEQIKEMLQKYTGYEYNIGEPQLQQDYYYDTPTLLLKERGCTLRIRQKGDAFEITIKSPTPTDISLEDQNERFEFQHSIAKATLLGEEQFIKEHLSFLNDNELEVKLTINTVRTPIMLSSGNICFEIALDEVEYINTNNNKYKDYQAEIELKSDYLHRVNLKMLSDRMEQSIPELQPSTTSKYVRGLTLTE